MESTLGWDQPPRVEVEKDSCSQGSMSDVRPLQPSEYDCMDRLKPRRRCDRLLALGGLAQ